ncbi:MAG: VOC family protein, partial [Bacteroidales bacterium]
MDPTHVEHIGIAVKDLNEAIPLYEKILGQPCYRIEEVPDQKVKTAFFKLGQTKIELLESTNPEGPVGRFIEKKGEGIHHIALAVRDLDSKLEDLE